MRNDGSPSEKQVSTAERLSLTRLVVLCSFSSTKTHLANQSPGQPGRQCSAGLLHRQTLTLWFWGQCCRSRADDRPVPSHLTGWRHSPQSLQQTALGSWEKTESCFNDAHASMCLRNLNICNFLLSIYLSIYLSKVSIKYINLSICVSFYIPINQTNNQSINKYSAQRKWVHPLWKVQF